MSRRVIRYEGEGRARRPIYADEGPAAAGAVDGVAAIGRLSALSIRETAGDIELGAGAVERRYVQVAEDAARRPDRPTLPDGTPILLEGEGFAAISRLNLKARHLPAEERHRASVERQKARQAALADRPALGSPEHLQQSRLRGGQVKRVMAVEGVGHREARRRLDRPPLITLADPPVTPPEDPAMASEPIPSPEPNEEPAEDPRAALTALRQLNAAVNRADDAWEELEAAEFTLEQKRDAWEISRRALLDAMEAVRGPIGATSTLERVAVAMELGHAAGRIEEIARTDPPAVELVDIAVATAEAELASLAERRHERLLNGEAADDVDHADLTGGYGEDPPELDHGHPIEAEADDAPATVTRPVPIDRHAQEAERLREAGGGPGRPATKQDRILSLVVRHAGDLGAIAAELHTDRGNVNATLHNAGKRGRLTTDMIRVLPAIFARYAPAGA